MVQFQSKDYLKKSVFSHLKATFRAQYHIFILEHRLDHCVLVCCTLIELHQLWQHIFQSGFNTLIMLLTSR